MVDTIIASDENVAIFVESREGGIWLHFRKAEIVASPLSSPRRAKLHWSFTFG